MFDKIREVVSQYVDAEDTEITEQSKFISDLGLDSLRLAAIMADLEDEFGVTISENDAAEFACIGDVLAFIDKK